MILEGAALLGCVYTANRLWNRERRDIKKIWKEIMQENGLVNEKGLTYNLARIEPAEYGHMLIVGIPIGFSFEELASKKDILESSLKGVIEMDFNKFNGWIKMKLIKKPLQNLKFEPVKTKPYELYIGYTYYKHVIVNMNTLPHLLIAGINGSGKTRGLYCLLTNLFHNYSEREIEAYMSQIGKTDLLLFKNCKQIKVFSRTPIDSLNMYQKVYSELQKREKLIEELMSKGVLNIETYNKKMPDKMKYIYVVSDEFSLYMPDNTDSKEEKLMKEQCLDILKKLIKLGRAYGIFVIVCLQKTTNDQMPQLIKSQVNCKMTFKQTDVYSSRNVIDNDDALELQNREAILIADERHRVKTPFIDDSLIKKYLNNSSNSNDNKIIIKVKLKAADINKEDGIIRRGLSAYR